MTKEITAAVKKSALKKKTIYFIGILATAALVLAVTAGSRLFNDYFQEKVRDERTGQLNEIVEQVGITFANSLDYNWHFLTAAQNLCERYEYASRDDIVAMAGWLDVITAAESQDAFFILLDDYGRSYDADGENGIWTDFDQVGTSKRSTFIADSRSYDGVYWAFVQKLDEPIATQDGETSVTHLAMLRSTEAMGEFFSSQAYQGISETYVLNESGTRMYDNSDQDDTLTVYNIYKALRGAENADGGDFDAVLQALEENGTASSECILNDERYCYSLYHLAEYKTSLLFLIPSSKIAVNTVEMASSLVRILIIGCMMIAIVVAMFIFISLKLQTRTRLYEQNQKNLQAQEAANRRLQEANLSLAQAQKVTKSALDIAESANKAKSNFLSSMSHDIRTPLHAIIGFEKLIERDANDSEKVRAHAGKIRVSSQHLLNLINDILDMSRIESGKTTLNMEPFTFTDFLAELKAIVEPQANARHQSFTVENRLPENLTVSGDRLRLNQILMNLLSNAVKYTDDGGSIRLLVEQLHTHIGGSMATLRFVVSDNGMGMSEDFLQRVFAPFEREHNTLTNKVQGTGLGMAITKNLVDLMGGVITVESRQGEGSTFTVELSFHVAENDGAASAEAAVSGADADELQNILKGCHFLVAEDNDINGEIILELLHMEGASCDIAKNGREALELFEKCEPGTYDAILMDVQMPVMNGYEATKAIRACKHPEALSIPIAAMTANAFAEDVQKALESGMNSHIAKPVDMKILKEVMFNMRHPQ